MANSTPTCLSSNWGRQNSNYRKKTEEIVARTAESFRSTVKTEDLFHETVQSLAKFRQEAAAGPGQTNEDFGIRRDGDAFSSPVTTTTLSSPYTQYNYRVISPQQRALYNMDHGSDKRISEKCFPQESCLGRRSSIQLSIFDDGKAEQIQSILTDAGYERLCGLCSIPPSQTGGLSQKLTDLKSDKSAMECLRKNSMKDYENFKLAITTNEIGFKKPHGRPLNWILSTMSLEVNGTMQNLSQYLTCADIHNIESMNDSVAEIMHQDAFLIDPVLQDIAKLFNQAISWKWEPDNSHIDELTLNMGNIHELKRIMALLQYEWAHAMPFKRGSSAIGEWLEMAIYQYHGLTWFYRKDKLVNLEALTSTLPEFVQNYGSDSIIKIIR